MRGFGVNRAGAVERPLGTYASTGNAIQSCSPGPATCANGAPETYKGVGLLGNHLRLGLPCLRLQHFFQNQRQMIAQQLIGMYQQHHQ